jgi:hypothetical protein
MSYEHPIFRVFFAVCKNRIKYQSMDTFFQPIRRKNCSTHGSPHRGMPQSSRWHPSNGHNYPPSPSSNKTRSQTLAGQIPNPSPISASPPPPRLHRRRPDLKNQTRSQERGFLTAPLSPLKPHSSTAQRPAQLLHLLRSRLLHST